MRNEGWKQRKVGKVQIVSGRTATELYKKKKKKKKKDMTLVRHHLHG